MNIRYGLFCGVDIRIPGVTVARYHVFKAGVGFKQVTRGVALHVPPVSFKKDTTVFHTLQQLDGGRHNESMKVSTNKKLYERTDL